MTARPTGTITFLFTDVEGSTKLWEGRRTDMAAALQRHDTMLRDCVEGAGGLVFKSVGDAFCAAFQRAHDGLAAALAAQRALSAEPWPQDCMIRVRMALHTGEADERDGDYFGPTLNRVARLLAAGHGGQVLVSLPCAELLRDSLPPDVRLVDLGEHHLKDLSRAERIFQVATADLPDAFPALKTLDARPNNLPAPATAFVGREPDVQRVRETLASPEVRLLTLTGPGGTGKTRLALEVGFRMLGDFPDGTIFVPLSSVTAPELVPEIMTRTLSQVLPDGHQGATATGIVGSKHALLVIDNFEQVLEAAALLTDLLGASPQVKLMVTSRSVLGLYGEHVYPVAPLALPAGDGARDLEALARYDSVSLFLQRARSVRPDFSLTATNARDVVEICRRLDGLPLAIELAASRVRVLPPKALLARLSRRLDVLTGGALDLPARQRTLRGAIDWSYESLADAEQVLFARLSVFVDGCTLEAIEAVCNAEGDLPIDVFEGVVGLVNASLLAQQTVADDEPRFFMLDTLREYALERATERAEVEALRRQHAAYYGILAEEAEGSRGAEQDERLDRLCAEHGNLRAALSWAMDAEEAQAGAVLAGALWDSGTRLVARR
jgi:predicted ATPase/class 3 adenylate cyclase